MHNPPAAYNRKKADTGRMSHNLRNVILTLNGVKRKNPFSK